jgi:hypothetical protein
VGKWVSSGVEFTETEGTNTRTVQYVGKYILFAVGS